MRANEWGTIERVRRTGKILENAVSGRVSDRHTWHTSVVLNLLLFIFFFHVFYLFLFFCCSLSYLSTHYGPYTFQKSLSIVRHRLHLTRHAITPTCNRFSRLRSLRVDRRHRRREPNETETVCLLLSDRVMPVLC